MRLLWKELERRERMVVLLGVATGFLGAFLSARARALGLPFPAFFEGHLHNLTQIFAGHFLLRLVAIRRPLPPERRDGLMRA